MRLGVDDPATGDWTENFSGSGTLLDGGVRLPLRLSVCQKTRNAVIIHMEHEVLAGTESGTGRNDGGCSGEVSLENSSFISMRNRIE